MTRRGRQVVCLPWGRSPLKMKLIVLNFGTTLSSRRRHRYNPRGGTRWGWTTTPFVPTKEFVDHLGWASGTGWQEHTLVIKMSKTFGGVNMSSYGPKRCSLSTWEHTLASSSMATRCTTHNHLSLLYMTLLRVEERMGRHRLLYESSPLYAFEDFLRWQRGRCECVVGHKSRMSVSTFVGGVL